MASKKTASKGNGSRATKHHADDGLAFLKEQHADIKKKIEALRKQISSRSTARTQALTELISAWSADEAVFDHAIEMFREAGVEESHIDEALIERDLVTLLMGVLVRADPKDAEFTSLIGVLARRLEAVMALEDGGEGLFAKAAAAEIDKAKLGEELSKRAEEIHEHAEANRSLPRLRFLRGAAKTSNQEFQDMRGNERERDEHGRFISEEDERRGGRYESRGGSSSGRRSREDDDYDRRSGSGWRGDSRGHSEAAHRGWEERRSSGRYEDDDDDRYGSQRHSSGQGYSSREERGGRGGQRTGGWFGHSEAHSEASRRGWDNPDHGQSGWYGDREGHSEASRRGWDNPDHGPSGWYGDREGHRRAAQRGWDNPDHGPSGWYGDSEGHSEASRRGWDERGRSSRRDEDDDDYGRRRQMRRR